MDTNQIQDFEIQLLLDAVQWRHGYDFRNYAPASLKRRILQCLSVCQIEHISSMIPLVLHEEFFYKRMLFELSVTVTDMFRDPYVYGAIREKVVPFLRTFGFINIWHAGCASGEEVYSMAILLQEEGLYEKTRIYATDFNHTILQQAKDGVFSREKMASYDKNYRDAGGKKSLSDYYHAKYDLVRMHDSLKRNIVFSNHNLVTDGVFGEMELILCRNVLIYFDKILQNRVLNLFSDSLLHGGFLCLGNKETLRFSTVESRFTCIGHKEKLYQKNMLGQKQR